MTPRPELRFGKATPEHIEENRRLNSIQRARDEAAAERAHQNNSVPCDKNVEIEKIKRILHSLIDRVDQLKSK